MALFDIAVLQDCLCSAGEHQDLSVPGQLQDDRGYLSLSCDFFVFVLVLCFI